MTRNSLSLLIATALLGAGTAMAHEPSYHPDRVRVHQVPITEHASDIGATRHLVDLDGDGVTDAVVTTHDGTALNDRAGDRLHVVSERDALWVGHAADLDPVDLDRWENRDGRPQVLGVGRELVDLDGDGFADAAVTFREELDLYPALDAVADAAESRHTMTGTRAKDAAVIAGIATRDAAAVATTDRPGERYNPAMKSRALHAHTGDGAPQPDDEARMAHRRDLLTTGRSAPDEQVRVTQFDGPVAVHRRDDGRGSRDGIATVEGPVVVDNVIIDDTDVDATRVEYVDVDRIGVDDVEVRNPPREYVIVNNQLPQDAMAPTAGSEGFSDGYLATQAQQRFHALDDDRDGRLDRVELPAASSLMARFDAYDLDGDQTISRNEFQSWYAATGDSDRAVVAAEIDLGDFD